MSGKNRNPQQYLSTSGVSSEPKLAQEDLDEDLRQQDEVSTTEDKPIDKPTETFTIKLQPVEVAKPTNEQSKVSATQTKQGFTPVYKVELELINYAEAMDKKNAMISEQGGKWQYSLFKAIKSCFMATSQEAFNAEFNTVLNFFNKNKDGIFNEKFIFRFPENWSGSSAEYSQNRRLVYLIIQTADPKNRKKALEQINMMLVAEGMSEPHKQMLFNYYQM